MRKILTNEEFKRMTEEYDKVKYKCKCGHKNIIPYNVDKVICGWCNRFVFKNKKDEDLYRIKERMRK